MTVAIGFKGENNETLRRIVDHIKSVVEEESRLLNGASFDGLDRIISRKDQLAIDLSRHVKRISLASIDAETRELLDDAAAALDSNAKLLRRHIDAVGDVAGLICNILVDANSDGTYTGSAARRGPRL